MIQWLLHLALFTPAAFTAEINVWEVIKIGDTVTYNLGPVVGSCDSKITFKLNQVFMIQGPTNSNGASCDYSGHRSLGQIWSIDFDYNLQRDQHCLFEILLDSRRSREHFQTIAKVTLICDMSLPGGVIPPKAKR